MRDSASYWSFMASSWSHKNSDIILLQPIPYIFQIRQLLFVRAFISHILRKDFLRASIGYPLSHLDANPLNSRRWFFSKNWQCPPMREWMQQSHKSYQLTIETITTDCITLISERRFWSNRSVEHMLVANFCYKDDSKHGYRTAIASI